MTTASDRLGKQAMKVKKDLEQIGGTERVNDFETLTFGI
jgi:hypothetical protein